MWFRDDKSKTLVKIFMGVHGVGTKIFMGVHGVGTNVLHTRLHNLIDLEGKVTVYFATRREI